jgi:uncharacterized damage-inducible protein DinB
MEHRMRRRSALIALALIASAASLPAQSFMGEMHRDLNTVQRKIVDLAKAMPAETFDWRPGPGVRSVREVFLHIAAENYVLPAMMGTAVPAGVALSHTDMKTVATYEARALTKEQVVADLEASFAHIHRAINVNTDANLGEVIKFFGMDFPRQRAMLGTVTHIHEHLGQLIAYARQNKVVPPWSQ